MNLNCQHGRPMMGACQDCDVPAFNTSATPTGQRIAAEHGTALKFTRYAA